MERALPLWRASEGLQRSWAGSPWGQATAPGDTQCVISSWAPNEVRQETDKRPCLVNTAVISAVITQQMGTWRNLYPCSHQSWRAGGNRSCGGDCVCSYRFAFSCKDAQCSVRNQRDFVTDYKTLCHGSFFRLIEFMMRFLSKKGQNISAYTGMAETLTNHWPGAKPRNTVMLLSSCNLSELTGHPKMSGKVACIGVGSGSSWSAWSVTSYLTALWGEGALWFIQKLSTLGKKKSH